MQEVQRQTILFSFQCSRSPSAARARGKERERLLLQGWVLKFKTASPSPGVAVWRLMSYLGRVQLFHMHRVHISDIINFTTRGVLSPLTSVPCAYDKQSLIKQHQQEKKVCGAEGWNLTFRALRRKQKKENNLKVESNLSLMLPRLSGHLCMSFTYLGIK